ncbi:hypothetical protein MXB_1387, partial [Myxobolus squamalis]
MSSILNSTTQLYEDFDIIVGTPSKCLVLLKTLQPTELDTIKVTVFDEADSLFGFGHHDSLDAISTLLSSRTQSFILSATLNEDVERLCTFNLSNPKRIVASEEPFPDSCQLCQYLIKCEVEDKIRTLEAFKSNKTQILVSTDLNREEDGVLKNGDSDFSISRGIDFANVENVINFDFPCAVASYIHRVGRTARANSVGLAFTFYTFDNNEYRVEDAIKSISKSDIVNARRCEIKDEIYGSDKIKAHFKIKPQDKLVLKADVGTRRNKLPPHLDKLPEYLIPS